MASAALAGLLLLLTTTATIGASAAAAAAYTKHSGQIPTNRDAYYTSLRGSTVAGCEARCSSNSSCAGFTYPERATDRQCWLYVSVRSLQLTGGYDYYSKGDGPRPLPPPPPPPPPPPAPCSGPSCFSFSVDWASGGAASSLPTANFSVRKLEAVYYPPDRRTYAYVDIINYTSLYYPASYSTEVGVYSSPNGFTNWSYHGIVIPRGAKGGWDGGGIASPGAAVAADGSVIVGYAAENSPAGGRNRGIGVAIAKHPLGPFVKQSTPIADPKTICGGTGRCDDVIMQSRPGGEIHIYHSVKGSNVRPGDGIRHRVSTDNGQSFGNSTLVLSTTLTPAPGHAAPAESIAGKYFPGVCSGKGGMVIITDGCKGAGCLHAYVSKTAGDMQNFVAATQPSLSPAEHPPFGPPGSFVKGDWASDAGQIGFVPDAKGNVAAVTYSLWNGDLVREKREYHGKYAMSGGYTHTVFHIKTDDDHVPSTPAVYDSVPKLRAGTRTLTLPKTTSGGGLGLMFADSEHVVLEQSAPAQIALAIKHGDEQTVSASYETATQLTPTLLEANATISHGMARLILSDRWSVAGSGALARFELHRAITVQSNPPESNVVGIQSLLLLDLADSPPSATIADLSAFAPGLWYGNNSGIISPGAIGADKALRNYFIRTDRFAAPLFSVMSPTTLSTRVRGRATIFSLDTGFQTVIADNASSVLIDDRLGYGALGLRQSSPDQLGGPAPLQLGYLFPGREYERTYTLGSKVLYRYHSARAGSVSRSSLAVTVDAVAVGDVQEQGELWGLIKAAWPMQRELYSPVPTNGSDATPTIADAREAIAATVTNSIFRAPTENTDGPQLGISGRRLENGLLFSGVFQMGFVCPQLKFAFGLLWDALARTSRNEERYSFAMEIINEWVRTSDLVSPDTARARSSGEQTVRLSHTAWNHGFGPPGCCPSGTGQGDGCPIVNDSLPACWSGTGQWQDDDGRFREDTERDPISWIRRQAEGHSLVLQAVALLEEHSEVVNSTWIDWVVQGTDNLVQLQREDGSWARAYSLEASASDQPFDTDPLLDRADTLFPVYFLADAAAFWSLVYFFENAKPDPCTKTGSGQT